MDSSAAFLLMVVSPVTALVSMRLEVAVLTFETMKIGRRDRMSSVMSFMVVSVVMTFVMTMVWCSVGELDFFSVELVWEFVESLWCFSLVCALWIRAVFVWVDGLSVPGGRSSFELEIAWVRLEGP